MKNSKSAKDLAFDRERAKYRSKIHDLENQISDMDKQIAEVTEMLRQKEEELLVQEDQIRRLLEYTEMSKEDLQVLIKSERNKTEMRDTMASAFEMMKAVSMALQ